MFRALASANILLKRPYRGLHKALTYLASGAFSHGQMIPARDIKPENGLHLRVDELPRDTETWKTLWHLYSCCDVLFNIPAGQNISKLFESAVESIPVH